jgi:hypothetical protein
MPPVVVLALLAGVLVEPKSPAVAAGWDVVILLPGRELVST